MRNNRDIQIKENGTIRIIHQQNLSSECFSAQAFGLVACIDCENKNTSACGGKNIIRTSKNKKGLLVPIS